MTDRGSESTRTWREFLITMESHIRTLLDGKPSGVLSTVTKIDTGPRESILKIELLNAMAVAPQPEASSDS